MDLNFTNRYIFVVLCALGSFLGLSSNPDSIVNTWQRKNLQKLAFKENAGQFKTSAGSADPNSLFKVEVQGLTIYLTKKGLTYFFLKPKSTSNSELKNRAIDKDSLEYEYFRFDIDLQNALIKKENIIKEGASGIEYNYFYPHCKNGIKGAREYDKLTLQNVYPGIDWVLYSSKEKGLKYDFIVHPFADPQQIKFLYKSLNPLQLTKDGNISINTSFGNFMDTSPESFLQKSRAKIESRYVLSHKSLKTNQDCHSFETEIGFKIGTYPKNEILVIDPLQLWWGTYYGGTNSSEGNSLTTDSVGNLFVLGSTRSLDLPLQPYGTLAYFQGIYGGNNNGGTMGDMFLLKFTNAGKLIWATYFGGQNTEEGGSLKCDQNGDIFVLGKTCSVDFPLKDAGGGAYYDTINGISDWIPDLFLGKFSNAGQYLWGTYYGGSSYEWAGGISIDKFNNVYFTGTTWSSNVPVLNPGGGAYFQNTQGGSIGDVVILKFSNSCQRLYATYFGGDDDDQALSTSSDSSGNVYFCGRTSSTNLYTLNPGGGAYFQNVIGSAGGILSGFILKLSNSGQALWSTYMSGINGVGTCNSILCDNTGNVFLAGRFGPGLQTVNPGGGAFYLGNSFNTPLVIAKFNNQSQMVWGTYFGTWGTSGFAKLTLGSCEEIYATFNAGSICPTCPPMPLYNPGNGAYYDSTYNNDYNMSLPDIYIAAFTNSGKLRWGTFFGGIGNDVTMPMACDRNGNIFYTGQQGFYYYNDSTALLSYSQNCIKDPGSGAYFQAKPAVPFLGSSAYAYCVIGKFTSPFTTLNLATSGCNINDTIFAQVDPAWGPYSYTWSTGANTSSITDIPTGTYTCIITDGLMGCKHEQQIYFGIPIILVSAQNDSICLNQSSLIEAQGADNYTWSPSVSLSASAGSTVNASPQTLTVYTVTGITNSNCSSTNTVLVFVNSLPIVSVSGNDSICKGLNTLLNASGGTSYEWIPNIGLASSMGSSVVAGPDQTMTYTVIGTDSHNCVDSGAYTLKIISLPQLQVTGPSSLCIGHSGTLTASGADLFHWSLGSTQFNSPTVIITPTTNINYTLSGINSAMCSDSILVPIHVFQSPPLSIQAVDSICEGEEFLMEAFGNGSFNWQPLGSLSCISCSSPSATLEVSTQYVVTLTDVNSCTNRASILIALKEGCGDDILIPNVFSPNSDQSNDLFKIKVSNIKAFECEIYDRWGIKLFHSNEVDISWNGTVSNGSKAPEGVYFYILKITKFNDQVKVHKGHLTLVR